MKFRYHSAMMGTLGVGCNILKFSDEDIKLSKELISEYKEIRHIVQEGDFYRLENTSKNNYSLYQYNNGDEALLFAFLPQSKIGHRSVNVKLRSLENNGKYRFEIDGQEIIKSGRYLMNNGIEIKLSGDYSSCIIKFNKINK